MDISNVDVQSGGQDNLKSCGLGKSAIAAIAMNVCSEGKTLELVLGSVGEAKQFCISLCKGAKTNNNVHLYASSMQVFGTH